MVLYRESISPLSESCRGLGVPREGSNRKVSSISNRKQRSSGQLVGVKPKARTQTVARARAIKKGSSQAPPQGSQELQEDIVLVPETELEIQQGSADTFELGIKVMQDAAKS